MNLTPKGKYILVKPDSASNTSEGGIILSRPVTPNTGVVVAVSEAIEDPAVSVGDKIRFETNGAAKMDDDNWLLKEEHILYVINPAY